jgi:hypothetical protein
MAKSLSYEEKQQTQAKRVKRLSIHWVVYVSVNLLLFFINYNTDYSDPWHIWVIASWGLGLGIHTTVVLISNLLMNSGQHRLAVHASITVLISAYLIFDDWFINYTLEWVGFVAVPLALIWLNHLGIYRMLAPYRDDLMAPDPSAKATKHPVFEKMVEKELEVLGPKIAARAANSSYTGMMNPQQMARKIVVNRMVLRNHILIYFTVNLYLIYLNYTQGMEYLWFLWPTMSWGVTIILHALSYSSWKQKTLGARLSMKYFLAYPLTFSLYTVFVDGFSNGKLNWFYWAVIPIILVSLTVARVRSRHHIEPLTTHDPSTARSQPSRPRRVQPETPANKFCPNCGQNSRSAHKFCEFCGYEIR